MEYRGRWFIRQQVWQCGDYTYIDTYPVFQKPGIRRKKCRPTTAIQARLNQRNAEQRAIRLIHLNFSDSDLELDLTFAGENPQLEDGIRAVQNYLRRVKRLYKKLGIDLKYFYALEQGKKSGRIHIHTILTGGADRDQLEAMWEHGYANTRRLQFTEQGITGLAKYVVKAGRSDPDAETKKPTYRRWSCSKNLIKPEPVTRDGTVSAAQVERLIDAIDRRSLGDRIRESMPGMELVEAVACRNAVNHGSYLHFSICKRERWKGRPNPGYVIVDYESAETA